MTRPSTYTISTTVRVLRTQYEALRKLPINVSVLIRVLVQLWLDGEIECDSQIAEEIQRAKDANPIKNPKQTQIAA